MNTTTLFGIPYAGGSAAVIYNRWSRLLPSEINVVPLELAGHGRRMSEPFHENLEQAVEDMLKRVIPVAQTQSYAFYGHSMGCVITHELVKALELRGYPPPQAVFLSGRNPPHIPYTKRNLHLLSDELFLQEIRELDGTPQEFFNMKNLMKTFLPILRSDYRLVERHRFTEPIHVMDTEFTFVLSSQDAMVKRHEAEEWQRFASRSFRMVELPGGHFFLNDQAETICRIIQDSICCPLAY